MTTLETPLITATAPLNALELLASLHRRGELTVLLRRALVEKLTGLAAREAGLSVPDADLQRAADNFRRHHGLHSADATRAWLDERQLTSLDLEAACERDLLSEQLKDHLFAIQGPARFEADRANYERLRLRRLPVATEGAARELLMRINEEGADFVELASKHHPDPTARANGDVGLVARWQLSPDVAKTLFAAKDGEVVAPVAVPNGFDLYQIEAHLPAELDTLTKARLRATLFDDWLRAKMADVRFDLSCLNGPHA